MQTQQNSGGGRERAPAALESRHAPCEHFLHVMWLQPPFFSMVLLHCGQSWVLTASQFAVSLSSAH